MAAPKPAFGIVDAELLPFTIVPSDSDPSFHAEISLVSARLKVQRSADESSGVSSSGALSLSHDAAHRDGDADPVADASAVSAAIAAPLSPSSQGPPTKNKKNKPVDTHFFAWAEFSKQGPAFKSKKEGLSPLAEISVSGDPAVVDEVRWGEMTCVAEKEFQTIQRSPDKDKDKDNVDISVFQAKVTRNQTIQKDPDNKKALIKVTVKLSDFVSTAQPAVECTREETFPSDPEGRFSLTLRIKTSPPPTRTRPSATEPSRASWSSQQIVSFAMSQLGNVQNGCELLFKVAQDCNFIKGEHIGIVIEQAFRGKAFMLLHVLSKFVSCDPSAENYFGQVTDLNVETSVMRVKCPIQKSKNGKNKSKFGWRLLSMRSSNLKQSIDMQSEPYLSFDAQNRPIICIFPSSQAAESDDEAVKQMQKDEIARHAINERCYAENQALISKVAQEKGSSVTLSWMELGTVVMRTGFLLAQPVISSIVKQIMNISSLGLSEKDKNCLHLFGSKDGPWDIYYMFVFLRKLFHNARKQGKDIFGRPQLLGEDVATFESRQEKINEILKKISVVRNWWAHVGVNFFDCLNNLVALKDFIDTAKSVSSVMHEPLIIINDSLSLNTNGLAKIIDDLRIQYNCYGSVSLSIDELSYLYLIRAFRRVVETCNKELEQVTTPSKLAEELKSNLEWKKKKHEFRVQSGHLEATDVARVVEKLLQKTNLCSFNDCRIIIKARNTLAHEPQQSGRVLAILCVLGSVIRLLEFISASCSSDGSSGTRASAASGITELRYYQARLLAHISPTNTPSVDKYLARFLNRTAKSQGPVRSILGIADLVRCVCLSNAAAIDANCHPGKQFVRGDLQEFQFLVNRKIGISKSFSDVFKDKTHRSLLHTAVRVPPCYTATRDAVDWMFSSPSGGGFLQCTGLELLKDIAEIFAESQVPDPSQGCSIKDKIEAIRQEILQEIKARADHCKAANNYEAALEADDRCFERPSADAPESSWHSYMQHKVSDKNEKTLKDKVQETRNTLSEKTQQLQSNLRSADVKGIKDSLVCFIDDTIASIMAVVPSVVGFSGFLYLRLPDPCLSPWTKLQKLLPYYFGSNDSTESIQLHSIYDPASCYPFHNIFRGKGAFSHESLFANSLKILSPLLDFHIANLSLYSMDDIRKIENSFGANLFDGLSHLVCLSSLSFKYEMIKWYQEKNIKTEVVGHWGYLSAIGCGDDKFTGREDELKHLGSSIGPFFEFPEQPRQSLVMIIGGEPGMGKTTLADHFLTQIQNKYFSRSQVYAHSMQGRGKEAVQDGLKYMASIILSGEDITRDSLSKLSKFLSNHRYVLFVDDVDKSGLKELMKHAPGSSKGSIIMITSQFHAILDKARKRIPQAFFLDHIELKKFSETDALKLVERVCASKNIEALQEQKLKFILGDSCLGFLPVGVRIFSKWLKGQLKIGSVDPLQQYIHKFSEERGDESAESFQGYRGLKTTVKLCVSRLEQVIRKQENCEGEEPCDALLKHFGILWLLSMTKPVQTPWSFFCVPEGAPGEYVRGSMVSVRDEGFLDDGVTDDGVKYISPVGEYVSINHEYATNPKVGYKAEKRHPAVCVCRVVTDTFIGTMENPKLEVISIDDGHRYHVGVSEFEPEGEVVFEPERLGPNHGRWRMRSKFDLRQFRRNWMEVKSTIRIDYDNSMLENPVWFGFRTHPNFVIGRVIRYHRNNGTASVQFVHPGMPAPGLLTDKNFFPQEFEEPFPSVGRFSAEHLQAFQPERDHIKQVLKIDVVSLNSSISSIAKTLQKSGLVRIGEHKRKGFFDMHQLLQRVLHVCYDTTQTLGYMSDGVGLHVMKSLLRLQFGSPSDEISYTRRRLTSIMEILDTAEVVLAHTDFSRRDDIFCKEMNWQEAMLMRLHEISILASSASSVSAIRLLKSVKSVLSKNISQMQQQQIQQVQQQQQLLLQEQQLLQLDMQQQQQQQQQQFARQQWSSSLLLRLSERETPDDRLKSLSTFDGLWDHYSCPHDEMKKRSFLHEWCVYASHLLMLRGDRQFEIDDRKEVYRYKRMGFRGYSEADHRPQSWLEIEHITCFQYWQESLNLRVACLGINHPYTARAYHRIARAFLDLDMPHPAIPLLNSARNILLVSICDANHFELGSICCDMGRAYELLLPRSDHSASDDPQRYNYAKWFKAPKVDDVQKQFKDALEFQKASSSTLDVATTLSFSGRFDAYQGNHDKAIESFEKAVRIQTDLIAPHHFALHDNRFLLAVLHGIKGDLAKADEYYQDAVLDRTKYNNMQAWSHLSMVADSFYSECGPTISCLPRDALISILTKTKPNLFRRDEFDNDTFVAVPFAERLSSMTNTMHDSSKSALSLERLSELCSNTFGFLNVLKCLQELLRTGPLL